MTKWNVHTGKTERSPGAIEFRVARYLQRCGRLTRRTRSEQEVDLGHAIGKLLPARIGQSPRREVLRERHLPTRFKSRCQGSADFRGMIIVFPSQCAHGLKAHDLLMSSHQLIGAVGQAEVLDGCSCTYEAPRGVLEVCARLGVRFQPAFGPAKTNARRRNFQVEVVCPENSNTGVVMVKSAENGV